MSLHICRSPVFPIVCLSLGHAPEQPPMVSHLTTFPIAPLKNKESRTRFLASSVSQTKRSVFIDTQSGLHPATLHWACSEKESGFQGLQKSFSAKKRKEKNIESRQERQIVGLTLPKGPWHFTQRLMDPAGCQLNEVITSFRLDQMKIEFCALLQQRFHSQTPSMATLKGLVPITALVTWIFGTFLKPFGFLFR